jgi:hypothetical protein
MPPTFSVRARASLPRAAAGPSAAAAAPAQSASAAIHAQRHRTAGDSRIDEGVVDDCADMVGDLVEHYYTTISRYTASAFTRLTLGEAFGNRGLAAHTLETRCEALESGTARAAAA